MVLYNRTFEQWQQQTYEPRPQIQGALMLQHLLLFEEGCNKVVLEGYFLRFN